MGLKELADAGLYLCRRVTASSTVVAMAKDSEGIVFYLCIGTYGEDVGGRGGGDS